MIRAVVAFFLGTIFVSWACCDEPIEVRWKEVGSGEINTTVQMWDDGTVVLEGVPPRLADPRLPYQTTLRVSGSVAPRRIEYFRRAVQSQKMDGKASPCTYCECINPSALHQLGEAAFTDESSLQADVCAAALALYVDYYIGITAWFSPPRVETDSVVRAGESGFPVKLVYEVDKFNRYFGGRASTLCLVLQRTEDRGLVATYSLVHHGTTIRRIRETDLPEIDLDLIRASASRLSSDKYPELYINNAFARDSVHHLWVGGRKYTFNNCVPVLFETLLLDQLYPLRARLDARLREE